MMFVSAISEAKGSLPFLLLKRLDILTYVTLTALLGCSLVTGAEQCRVRTTRECPRGIRILLPTSTILNTTYLREMLYMSTQVTLSAWLLTGH